MNHINSSLFHYYHVYFTVTVCVTFLLYVSPSYSNVPCATLSTLISLELIPPEAIASFDKNNAEAKMQAIAKKYFT